jgi:16S rRNA (guanine527-N7)-methyltransferase
VSGREPVAWRTALLEVWAEGQRLSAVGPGDVSVHLEHAMHLADQLQAPGRAVDLGSGAGIPGLALAGLWPESRWTLVDAAQRRTRLLERAVHELGWADRVRVVHVRAEDLGRQDEHRGRYDLVTARLFGPPSAAAECGAPLLRIGGILAVTEPPDPAPDRWPADAVAPLGLEATDPEPGLQRFRAVRAPEDRFPRKAGVPVRRPLF